MLGGPNTGKTWSALLINSFLGFHERGLWSGSASSGPGIYERAEQQADMPLMVDELVTRVKGGEDTSKKMKDVVHTIYDHSTRANCRTVRTPRATMIGTVRATPASTRRSLHICCNCCDRTPAHALRASRRWPC